MQDNIGHFGPAVLGEDTYETEQALLQEAGGPGSKFGPSVTEHPESGPEAASELAEDAVPDGYELDMVGPNLYEVTTPAGEQLEGPSPSGYFRGKVAARQAAWEHALSKESERKEEAESAEPQGAIEEIRDTLEANPDAVDEVMNREFQRDDEPRQEVLQAIYEAEQAREGDPRTEILTVLADFGIDVQ